MIPDEMQPGTPVMTLDEALDVALEVIAELISRLNDPEPGTNEWVHLDRYLGRLKAARDRLIQFQAMQKDVCDKLDI